MLDKLIAWLVTKQLRPVLVNWKTTLAGVLILLPHLHDILTHFGELVQVLAGVADGGSFDLEHAKKLVAVLGVSIGLVFSRDGNVSSEKSTGETPTALYSGRVLSLLAFATLTIFLVSCETTTRTVKTTETDGKVTTTEEIVKAPAGGVIQSIIAGIDNSLEFVGGWLLKSKTGS